MIEKNKKIIISAIIVFVIIIAIVIVIFVSKRNGSHTENNKQTESFNLETSLSMQDEQDGISKSEFDTLKEKDEEKDEETLDVGDMFEDSTNKENSNNKKTTNKVKESKKKDSSKKEAEEWGVLY